MASKLIPLDDRCSHLMLCSDRGYHGIECLPPVYRWAGDKLAAEFGADHVRVSFVCDYGWTQGVAVVAGEVGRGIPVQRGSFDGREPFCINDAPEQLDALIDRVRSASRGFGT